MVGWAHFERFNGLDMDHSAKQRCNLVESGAVPFPVGCQI